MQEVKSLGKEQHVVLFPATQSLLSGPAAWASPRSLSEMQNLGCHPRLIYSECACQQYPWMIHMHITVKKALVFIVPYLGMGELGKG